jgi:hypothetical protein
MPTSLPDPERKGKGRRKTRGAVPALPPPPSRRNLEETLHAEHRPDHDAPDWRVEGPDMLGVAPWADGQDETLIPLYMSEANEEDTLLGLTEAERELYRKACDEIAKRAKESLRIFQPMPEQERFFASHAPERVALGGNRGGKTTVTCVEIARAVTGQDPYDKYPKTDGKCILVGRDLKHCSKVFFDKLFVGGAFKVIRDLHTGEWRSFRPQHPDDIRRPFEARPSPPLIPKRLWNNDCIAWENKKDQTPRTIRLFNGWEIYFFSADGTIPQGWAVHLVVFDEEIEKDGWYKEMAARLLDHREEDPDTGHVRGGKFMWSATPQAGTQRLYSLCQRYERDLEGMADAIVRGEVPGKFSVEVFRFGLLDNEYMSRAAVNELIAKYEDDPEEYEVRIKGNFALLGTRVYGEFQKRGVHGIMSNEITIDSDWTRYVAIDPGYQTCAVLFCAVPPPGNPWEGHHVIYDELYIRRSSGPLLAARMAEKIGWYSIHKMLIDHKAGGQHDYTSGKTHEENYSAVFREAGVACELTGHEFSHGNPDPKAGIEAVRQGLAVVNGKAKWLVLIDKCKWFLDEIEKYSYKKSPDGSPTDEVIKAHDHLMDCWRYLAQGNLRWIRPQQRKRKLGYTQERLEAKKLRAQHRAKTLGGPAGIKVG